MIMYGKARTGSTATAAPRTRTTDGRVMIGHVVLARGRGADGADSIAVRQVGTHGATIGAWVAPVAGLDASWLAQRCAKRAVVAWDEAGARAAGPLSDPPVVTLPDAIGQVAEVRRRYAGVLGPVLWEVDLPAPVPPTIDELAWHARVPRRRAASPVEQEALLLHELLTWTVERWQETAEAFSRSDRLRRGAARPGALPPAWERRLADAYAARP